MPLVYAETSALFAYLHPRDIFSKAVDAAVQKESPDFIYWSFLRFELRHSLRQMRGDIHGETGWRALRAAEKTASRLRWQNDLDVNLILDLAEELSAENAGILCGGSDIIHIAAARRLNLLSGLDEFWTCDISQAKLARAVGLKTRLFK